MRKYVMKAFMTKADGTECNQLWIVKAQNKQMAFPVAVADFSEYCESIGSTFNKVEYTI